MVFCSKCGQENPDDAKYCSKCGALIKDYSKDEVKPKEEKVDKVEIIEKDNKPKSKILNYIAYFVILICVLIILLVPTKTIYETKQESYTSYENYIVQEPYLKEETYETNNIIEEEICDKKYIYIDTNTSIETNNNNVNIICSVELSSDELKDFIGFYPSQEKQVEVIMMIYNNEDVITIENVNNDNNHFYLSNRGIINSYSVALSEYESKTNWRCMTNLITKYVEDKNNCQIDKTIKPTTQTKQVTAYKDVTKQRPVTKYKDVEVAKKVNWILGVTLFWNN